MYPKKNKKINWQYQKVSSVTPYSPYRFYRYDPNSSGSVYGYWGNSWLELDLFPVHVLKTETDRITEEELMLELL